MATKTADAEGHTVGIFDVLRDYFASYERSYNEQVALIVKCINSDEEAVELLKSIGSGVS